MITINGKYHIHTQWEELTPKEFIFTVKTLRELFAGKLSLLELRTRLLCKFADIDKMKVSKDRIDLFSENIYRAALHMNFPYKFVYQDDRFRNLSEDMQQRLLKTLPEDIEEPEAIAARKFKRVIDLDACFGIQLLPFIKYGKRERKRLKGYVFQGTGDLVHTSLSAEQYIDATTVCQQYYANRDITVLQLLVAILYCPAPYSSEKAQALAAKIAQVNTDALQAVLFNFEAITQWISRCTKYHIIFTPSGEKSGNRKMSLGMSAVLYSLSERGYGSLSEVGNISLFTFFDIIIKGIIDSVKQLHDLKVKRPEIAKKLHLSLDIINQII